ncbi:CHAT domain-containing protein [Algibacter pacificus]|uniref:CHAT domain-containing protein n=1 Tax=Algibacter pacificus TaxID=2599389 RepID=UPI0011C7132E|nr:CHAT domain-containing protein [Algibacter pacificus]
MKICCFLLFFITLSSVAQNLEETIYLAAERFIENKKTESLKLLNKQESLFKNQVKSKEEQLALVFLQTHKAFYLFQQSELTKAIITYEDALNRFNENQLSQISDFDIIDNCLNPLGTLYTKTGDFTNALNTINQYIFLAEKTHQTKHQISGIINLAKLYATLGKHETAIKTVDEGLKINNSSETQKRHLLQIKTESLNALNLFSASSSFKNDRQNYLLHLKKKDYKKAFTAFSSYKKNELQKHLTKRETEQLYIEEAQLYFLLKQSEKALTFLNMALKMLLPEYNGDGFPTKHQLYAENKFIDIFDLYAEIETSSEKALQSLELSFYVSSLLQSSWTSQETKILNETNNRIRSEKCIDILYNAFNETQDTSYLKTALQYAENSKSSVLKTMFLKKLRLQRFPKDSLLIKEFKLLKTQEQLTSLLVKAGLGSKKINDLSIQLSNISMQLKSLNRRILEKHPNEDVPFQLTNLNSKLLKDHATLAEYFYGKNSIYQFIISGKSISLNRIEYNADVKNQISAFINLFNAPSTINNDISNYTKQAFSIYKLLNLKALSTTENAIIIPDGLLNFLPFEALLTKKTETTAFSRMPFVIENQNIIYNSSIILYLNETKKQKHNNEVLGFFPVFENTNQALTYSINEAHAIADYMPSKLFMKADATKNNFFKNASDYDIIHLSTHASSGDFVKPSNLSFFDDTLFLNELYSQDLNPNLVVLSACETGIGKLYKGEGAMSIARGFQYAGAENILFSLWQINDLSTAQIMASFYKNYKESQSAYIANRTSKISYLKNESISNVKKSPYYWSAFVYYGELVTPKTKNFTIYICIGILITLFIVFLAMKLKRNDNKSSRVPFK